MCIAVKAKVLDADQLEFKSQLHFLLLVGEFCFLKNEVVDTEKERERLTKDLEKITNEMNLL